MMEWFWSAMNFVETHFTGVVAGLWGTATDEGGEFRKLALLARINNLQVAEAEANFEQGTVARSWHPLEMPPCPGRCRTPGCVLAASGQYNGFCCPRCEWEPCQHGPRCQWELARGFYPSGADELLDTEVYVLGGGVCINKVVTSAADSCIQCLLKAGFPKARVTVRPSKGFATQRRAFTDADVAACAGLDLFLLLGFNDRWLRGAKRGIRHLLCRLRRIGALRVRFMHIDDGHGNVQDELNQWLASRFGSDVVHLQFPSRGWSSEVTDLDSYHLTADGLAAWLPTMARQLREAMPDSPGLAILSDSTLAPHTYYPCGAL